MKMAKRLLSIVLAVLMLLSVSSVAVSAYTVPDGFKLAVNEGNDETGINGEIYGLIGDADMSDAVNVRDATLIQKFAASIVTLDDVQKILADVNFDESVNVKDATPIQKWVAGIETLEPINKLIYTPEKETEPSTTVPVVTEPATSEPVVTDPATTEPATSEPVVTDPVVTEPATSEPVVTDPAVTEPATSEPVVTEPAVTEPATSEPVVTEPATTEAPADTITIYFSNNKGWENVYIYAFYGVEGEAATGEPMGAYPGTKMTFVETNSFGQDIYSAEVPADIDYIKFADGTDANNRTNNIGKDKIADNAGFYLTEVISGTKWNYDTYVYENDTPADTTAAPATTPATGDELTTAPVVTEPATTEAPAKGITVRFSNNRGWDAVRVHYWGAEETKWPGVAMTKVDTNEYGQDVYEITLPEGTEGVVFNNNNNGQQTVDVTPVDGTGYYCDGDSTPYEVGTYEIVTPVEPTTTAPATTEAPVVTEPATTTPAASEDEPATTAPASSDDEPATTAPVVTEPATTAPVVTEPATTEAPADTITIYFSNNKGWENVYIYGFYGVEGEAATGEPMGAYPGTKMTFVEKNSFGQDIYSAEVPADIDYIKFADGTDANNRTNNIGKDKIADNAGFYLTEVISGTKWNYDTYVYENDTPADTTAAPVVTEPATTVPASSDDEPATTAPVVTEPATTAPVVTEPATTEAPAKGITVRFSNNRGWDAVRVHYWGAEETKWPGVEMTKVDTNEYGQDVYEITLPEGTEGVVFNNNNNGQQTVDVKPPVDGTGYYCDGDSTPYEVGTYKIEVPVVTEPATTAPVVTEPATTAPVVTEPATTAPVVTEPATTAPVVTEPATTAPVVTEPATTAPVVTEPATTAPVVTEPATTAPVVTEPATTAPVVTEPATTAPVVTEPATTAPVVTEPATTEAPAKGITVRFSNNRGWDAVRVHYWGAEETQWPGVEMTKIDTNEYGQDVYEITLPEGTEGVVFNNNNNGQQTVDVAPVDGTGYYCDGDSTPYEVGTYEIVAPVEPTTTEAATTAPVVTDPVATEPATTTPVVTEPVVTEPATTAPVVTEPAPTEPAGVTVYAINSAKWDTVCAYYWGGIDVAWPGTAMAKTGDTVNGFDVYSITFETAPQNIIFNNNNNGSQTADLTFEAGKYFDIKAGKWYESLDEVPEVSKLSTDRYLVGSFNGWSTTANEFTITAEGEKIAYVEMELEANKTYEFKIVREGKWTSCKTTLNITDSAEGLTFSSSVSGNTKLVTKAAGTYVFAFGLDTSQLAVTYPK